MTEAIDALHDWFDGDIGAYEAHEGMLTEEEVREVVSSTDLGADTLTMTVDGDEKIELSDPTFTADGVDDFYPSVEDDGSLIPPATDHTYEGSFETTFDLADDTVEKHVLKHLVAAIPDIDMDDLDVDIDGATPEEFEEAIRDATDVLSDELTDDLDAPSLDAEMSTISWGVSDDLAKDYEDLISGTGDATADDLSDTTDSPIAEFDVPIRQDLVDDLLQTVYEELHETGTEIPETLILGLPQFTMLQAWSIGEYDRDIEDKLPVDEITTVPGPQIHAVGEQNSLLYNYLEENYGDDA